MLVPIMPTAPPLNKKILAQNGQDYPLLVAGQSESKTRTFFQLALFS
jgi:hypothetical protein